MQNSNESTNNIKIKREYNYQDIYMKPRKTIVSSRKDCDTKVTLGKHEFMMPIYPANMKSVVNENTCKFIAQRGWFYTMHRFNVDQVAFIHFMQEQNLLSSISVGVNDDAIIQLKAIKQAHLNPDFITLDIANAWCDKAKNMIDHIKTNFTNTFLIVGNAASIEATCAIHEWGADAIKVGIAGGRVCITKNKTGFHRPMVSTILDCAAYTKKHNVPLIADGGIVEHGDIAKAIACGANLIMAGSLFAGYDQSAGDIIEITMDGRLPRSYKEYYGSASQYNKGEYKNVEGKKILIDYRGNMERLLQELHEDLQSSISYGGCTNLTDFRELGTAIDIIAIN